MSANQEIPWIKIGKYTINLNAVRFVVEHDEDEGGGRGPWLEVWCAGETRPVIQLLGNQAEAFRRYLAFPKRVEDLTPEGDALLGEPDATADDVE